MGFDENKKTLYQYIEKKYSIEKNVVSSFHVTKLEHSLLYLGSATDRLLPDLCSMARL